MLLAIAATEIEMSPFLALRDRFAVNPRTLVCGVGPVESAVTVARYLERHHTKIEKVVNFGIGGAYLHEPGAGADVLDLCLAGKEVLGDYGVCTGMLVEPFSNPALCGPSEFILDPDFTSAAGEILREYGIGFHLGTFVTVNGASGDTARGSMLRDRFGAICENMEGGAIARTCEEFSLPLLEIRTISNIVEDRPGEPWKIEEASTIAARAAFTIMNTLGKPQ